MSWWEVSLSSPEKLAEKHSEMLQKIGALSVTFLEAGDVPILEPAPGDTPLWSTVKIKALFEKTISEAMLKKQIQNAFNNLDFTIDPLEEQDWVSLCQADFNPMCFGEKLWIVPSWADPIDNQSITLKLDPGLAFGTGTHPTTALCLNYLAKCITLNSTVIDYGCGSGILGIGAALLGANHVIAIDHDQQALISTKNNAEQNNVLDCIHTYHTSTLPNPLPKAEFVVANILSETLISLKNKIADAVIPGGTLLLSGILREQAPKVIAAYQELIQFEAPIYQDEWTLLAGKRTQT